MPRRLTPIIAASEGSPTLAEILALAPEPPADGEGRGNEWPTVSASALAILQIADCEEQLARAETHPIRLVQAAKCSHSSLHCALTAALAGSMGIGAYNEELEQKWRDFLQEGTAGPPVDWRVLHFNGLLKKARGKPLEWSQSPLVLRVGDDEALVTAGVMFVYMDGKRGALAAD